MTATRIPLPPGHRWTAERDQVAHLLPARGTPLSAACGRRAPDERWAWPPDGYCPECLAIAEVRSKRRR